MNATLEKEAKKRGFRNLTLEVWRTNERAKKIYKHWGYTYLKDALNPIEIVMIKTLR